MRCRLPLGLIAVLALALAACGAPAGDAPTRRPAAAARTSGGPAAAHPGTARSSCPTTHAQKPPFVPPAPYPAKLPPRYREVWYGTSRLWTSLRPDGTMPMLYDQGVYTDKSFWWHERYDPPAEPEPGLQVWARRLDAPAPTVTAPKATNGFNEEIGAFMLTGLELPAAGCWEVTGRYAGTDLTFVVWVPAATGHE